MPPILISNRELDPLLIFLRSCVSRFFKNPIVARAWLKPPEATSSTWIGRFKMHVARREMVWPVECGARLHVRTVVLVVVCSTIGFSWRCLLKRTIGINTTHSFSRSWRSTNRTSMSKTVPNVSEPSIHLIFRRTHSVDAASRDDRMAEVLFLKLLRTCECSGVLLRQRAGEWAGSMVSSRSSCEESFGPPVAIKWVQHCIADVVASIGWS